MKGNAKWQVTEVFKKSSIFKPGESKHADKQNARDTLKKEGKTGTSQGISEHTSLHAYSTAYDYKETWHEFAEYAFKHLNIKDIEKIDSEHVQAFLRARIEDCICYSTWKKEAAHLGKLANALILYNKRDYNFRQAINDIRAEAHEALDTIERDRGFVVPENVIRELRKPDMKLAARVQLEGGARCHEATLIRETQLSGISEEHHAGRVHLTNTKGGMPRTISIRPETYEALVERLQSGEIRIKNTAYRSAVALAAKRAGEIVTGTHDFRYNFAHNRFRQLTKAGYTAEQAHYLISQEMGHHRPDITLHYLM
ncbi:MAG: hypothetical protein R3Y11_06270 [Pseudomonadota bacterium]